MSTKKEDDLRIEEQELRREDKNEGGGEENKAKRVSFGRK